MTAPAAHNEITRRQFLKFSGLGLAALLVPPLSYPPNTKPAQLGRVIHDKTPSYETPSTNGSRVRFYWKDNVFLIQRATVGESETTYNRIWYQIGEAEFVHSSGIQPVRTVLNQPAVSIIPEGELAEVTVPFTDAHWGPGRETPVAYRYYYETTHWVVDRLRNADGEDWYQILDDKWDLQFYTRAHHLRLIPPTELAPLSPRVPASAKRLEIRTKEQVMIAFERDRPVFTARIASGARFRTGDYSTPTGTYTTFHKRPSRHMAAGDLASNGYDLPGVPWVTYFTEEGMAIHGTYWHNDYGAPRSHGCINLTPQAARWVYLWTIPPVPAGEQRIYETFGTKLDVV
jgi:lipoprotein-anchoring transpeptidase ErfK/SrfK